jgi:hypothetical protein
VVDRCHPTTTYCGDKSFSENFWSDGKMLGFKGFPCADSAVRRLTIGAIGREKAGHSRQRFWALFRPKEGASVMALPPLVGSGVKASANLLDCEEVSGVKPRARQTSSPW